MAMASVTISREKELKKVLGAQIIREEKEMAEIRQEISDLEQQSEQIVSKSLYLRIAIDYWRIKEFEEAQLAWEKAEKIAPNDEEVKIVERLILKDTPRVLAM